MTNTTWSSIYNTGSVTLSGSDLIVKSTAGVSLTHSADFKSTGKYYFEITCDIISNSNTCVGIALPSVITAGSVSGAYCVNKNGSIYIDGSYSGSLGTISNGNVIGVAADFNLNRIWFRVGAAGNWNNNVDHDPALGLFGFILNSTFFSPYASLGATNEQVTLNSGNSTFVGVVPDGFTAGWPTGSSTDALLSQASIELWDVPLNSAALSQSSIEIWTNSTPATTYANTTQTAIEVWTTVGEVIGQSRMSQVSIEIWYPVAKKPKSGAILLVGV